MTPDGSAEGALALSIHRWLETLSFIERVSSSVRNTRIQFSKYLIELSKFSYLAVRLFPQAIQKFSISGIDFATCGT